MQEAVLKAAIKLIRDRDPRFAADAYVFVREALEHKQARTPKDEEGRAIHIRGPQVLDGIREYALSRFGPMTITVFEDWGVHSCVDFGEIVFNLIDQGLATKTAEDTRADFADGYDFQEAFRDPFLPPSKLPPSRRGERPATAPSR